MPPTTHDAWSPRARNCRRPPASAARTMPQRGSEPCFRFGLHSNSSGIQRCLAAPAPQPQAFINSKQLRAVRSTRCTRKFGRSYSRFASPLHTQTLPRKLWPRKSSARKDLTSGLCARLCMPHRRSAHDGRGVQRRRWRALPRSLPYPRLLRRRDVRRGLAAQALQDIAASPSHKYLVRLVHITQRRHQPLERRPRRRVALEAVVGDGE